MKIQLEATNGPAALLTYEERSFLTEILNKPEPEAKEIQQLKENFAQVTYVEINVDNTSQTISILAAGLRGNTTVKTLTFKQKISDQAMCLFCEKLSGQTCIQNLEFCYLDVNETTLQKLASFQSHATSGISLRLGINLNNSCDLSSLAQTLRSNNYFNSLHLTLEEKHNPVIIAIAEALEISNSLTFIELNVKKIYLDQLIAFVEALYFNRGLKGFLIHSSNPDIFNGDLEEKYHEIKLMTQMNRSGNKSVHPISKIMTTVTPFPLPISDIITSYLPWRDRFVSCNPAIRKNGKSVEQEQEQKQNQCLIQ